jgi:hypothetical protein
LSVGALASTPIFGDGGAPWVMMVVPKIGNRFTTLYGRGIAKLN